MTFASSTALSRFKLACRLSSSARCDLGGDSPSPRLDSVALLSSLDDDVSDILLSEDTNDAWLGDSVDDTSRMDVGDSL